LSSVLKELQQRLSNGLNRASIQLCSRWALEYRVMGAPYPGRWSFDHHPWTRAMHDSQAQFNVGMKAAQMGFTEVVLNVCFYTIDILKQDVLYVLPNQQPDAADFSKGRFDPALVLSDHLKQMFSDVKNVGHKRAGSANMFIRGSGSRSGLKSIPTPKIILDELAEMNQENIPLAFERASGQQEKDRMVWMVSTPLLQKKNIHAYFLQSSQEHFFFKCPHCSKLTELVFPDCLVICGDDENDPRVDESHLICKECKVKLPHESKIDWLRDGQWVATHENRDMRGFHISQLYSMTISPKVLAITHHKALRDPAQEQEFWNSKLGLPHEVKGARVSNEQVQDAKGQYGNGKEVGRNFVCMGVDVGKRLHIEITDYRFKTSSKHEIEDLNAATEARVLFSGTRTDFEELDVLMQEYGVRACVVDANPETREARKLAARHWGRVFLCFYGKNIRGKAITHNEEANTLTVDRTSWLDASLGRFKNAAIKIPVDVTLEMEEHIQNLVRVYVDDKDGNKVAKYENTGPDHFGHARNYCEIALPMACASGQSHSIRENMT
jgi:hypothetical protein